MVEITLENGETIEVEYEKVVKQQLVHGAEEITYKVTLKDGTEGLWFTKKSRDRKSDLENENLHEWLKSATDEEIANNRKKMIDAGFGFLYEKDED